MSELYLGSIDLSKINKEKLYTHTDGRKFLKVSIWVNEQPDSFGNHLSIQQSTQKGEQTIYVGNCKRRENEQSGSNTNNVPQEATDDLPF